jgi:hypothetical protein
LLRCATADAVELVACSDRVIATDFEDGPRWVRAVVPSMGRIYTWENIKINANKKSFVMKSHNQTGAPFVHVVCSAGVLTLFGFRLERS